MFAHQSFLHLFLSLHPLQSAHMAGLALAASLSALVRTATTVILSQGYVCVITAGLELIVKRVKFFFFLVLTSDVTVLDIYSKQIKDGIWSGL